MRQSKTIEKVRPAIGDFKSAWEKYMVAHTGYVAVSVRRQSTLMREHVSYEDVLKINADSRDSLKNLLRKESTLKTSWKALKAVMRKQNQNMR